MSELLWYISQDPKPDDNESVKATLSYLEACKKIFERGFLSHDKVCDPNCKVIRSIKEGFSFFMEWHASLSKDGKCLFTVYLHILLTVFCTT